MIDLKISYETGKNLESHCLSGGMPIFFGALDCPLVFPGFRKGEILMKLDVENEIEPGELDIVILQAKELEEFLRQQRK